jgi:O-antigen chain-terminating methyltransferase
MLETKNPEIDISELLVKIADELKAQKKKQRRRSGAVIEEELVINDPYSWGQLSETLDVAEQNVNAGAEVTSMLHYRGIVRKVARVLGKVTIFLGRVITIPQRNFNSSMLHSQRIILDGIRGMNRNTAILERQMVQLEEKSLLIDYLKTGLVTQERRVSILLQELRNQVSTGVEDVAKKHDVENVPDILDPLYLAFEDQFRGSREEIRDRLLDYVPLMLDAGAGTDDRMILDIGCGRGEWLELMKDEGLTAKGLDLNSVLVAQCREKGFEVDENDALKYLRSLPDNSLGAITSFHLIEHLDFETRVALFDESVRVLKPGGVALFETPNPRNLLVGSCNFWADPTHLRPLYPETHQFLMEYRGFCKVELLFLHPHEGQQRLPEEEAPQLASRLNEVFSCARDYAIVGYKV